MAMMPPSIVVAAVPTVVVAVTAVMAPPMPMPVAPFDLNNCLIGSVQSIGCCCGHSLRLHNLQERKYDIVYYNYPFYFGVSSFAAFVHADYQFCLYNVD